MEKPVENKIDRVKINGIYYDIDPRNTEPSDRVKTLFGLNNNLLNEEQKVEAQNTPYTEEEKQEAEDLRPINFQAGNILPNLWSSAKEEGGKIWEAVRHPVDTAVGGARLLGGLGPALFGVEATENMPTEGAEALNAANAFLKDFGRNYGSPNRFLKTLYEHPLSVGGDLLTVSAPITGGARLLTKGAAGGTKYLANRASDKAATNARENLPIAGRQEALDKKAQNLEQLASGANTADRYVRNFQIATGLLDPTNLAMTLPFLGSKAKANLYSNATGLPAEGARFALDERLLPNRRGLRTLNERGNRTTNALERELRGLPPEESYLTEGTNLLESAQNFGDDLYRNPLSSMADQANYETIMRDRTRGITGVPKDIDPMYDSRRLEEEIAATPGATYTEGHYDSLLTDGPDYFYSTYTPQELYKMKVEIEAKQQSINNAIEKQINDKILDDINKRLYGFSPKIQLLDEKRKAYENFVPPFTKAVEKVAPTSALPFTKTATIGGLGGLGGILGGGGFSNIMDNPLGAILGGGLGGAASALSSPKGRAWSARTLSSRKDRPLRGLIPNSLFQGIVRNAAEEQLRNAAEVPFQNE